MNPTVATISVMLMLFSVLGAVYAFTGDWKGESNAIVTDSSGETIEANETLESYSSRLVFALNKRISDMSFTNTGTCEVRLRIGRDGAPTKVNTTGCPFALSQEIKQNLMSMQPLPTPPKEHYAEVRTLKFPITAN